MRKAPRVRKDFLEPTALTGPMVRMVPMAPRVRRDLRVPTVLTVPRVRKVFPARTAPRVPRGRKARKDRRDPLVPTELRPASRARRSDP